MQAAPRSPRWELLIEAGPPSFPFAVRQFQSRSGAILPGLAVLHSAALVGEGGGPPAWAAA